MRDIEGPTLTNLHGIPLNRSYSDPMHLRILYANVTDVIPALFSPVCSGFSSDPNKINSNI